MLNAGSLVTQYVYQNIKLSNKSNKFDSIIYLDSHTTLFISDETVADVYVTKHEVLYCIIEKLFLFPLNINAKTDPC